MITKVEVWFINQILFGENIGGGLMLVKVV
jgi:hypothetical protein